MTDSNDPVNDAFRRYQEGEPNKAFDRLIATADRLANGTIGMIDLSDLSDDEFIAALFKGPDD